MSGDERKHSDRRRGRTSFIASGIVLAVLAAAGITLVVWNAVEGATTAPSTASPTTPPAPSTPAIAEADQSVCGLPGFEDAGTFTEAPDTEWVFVGTLAVPDAPSTAGPGVIDDDGYRSCFAHTRDGAVVAASSYIATGGVGTLVRKMIENAVVPGPGQQATLDRLQYGANTDAFSRLSIQGVRLLGYTGATATVDVALVSDDGAMFGDVFTLNWVDGDWKIVLTDAGQPPIPPSKLSSLAGYVLWKAP